MIPILETSDVELNAPSHAPAARQGNLLHHLLLRDALLATIASFGAAGTDRDCLRPVTWQTPIVELVPD